MLSSADLAEPLINQSVEIDLPPPADPIKRNLDIEKAIFDKFSKPLMQQIYRDEKDIQARSTPARLKFRLNAPTIFITQETVILHDDKEVPPTLGRKTLSRPECDILATVLSKRNKTCTDKITKGPMLISLLLLLIMLNLKSFRSDIRENIVWITLSLVFLRFFYQSANHCKVTVLDEDLTADEVREFRDKRTAYTLILSRINNIDEQFRTMISACATPEMNAEKKGEFESNALEALDDCSAIQKKIHKIHERDICRLKRKVSNFFISASPLGESFLEENEKLIFEYACEGDHWTDQECSSLALRPRDIT